MLLDLAAYGVAVLVGHDHVGDDNVGLVLVELREGGSRIRAGDHVDVFPTERDLDDFAHGGAVVDEIHGWRTLGLFVVQRWNGHRFAHSASLSAMSRVPSSYSRMASSMRSVADRSTVRCGEVVP